MWWIQFPVHSVHCIQVSAVAGAVGPLQTMILWKPTPVSPCLCSILFWVVCCRHRYMWWCIGGHVFCGVSCRPVESVCFASCFYAIFYAFNSCVMIQKSYAIFQKYDDKLRSTFSRYTFEDTFPDAMILTWCVLGALNQLCRVSQCMQTKHCFRVTAKPLAKKPENFICVLAKGKDYAFCKACHKLVMVTVSCQYNVTRLCQSDDHLGAVTKRMQRANWPTRASAAEESWQHTASDSSWVNVL